MSELQKISDRGATPYFHGRETILNRFEDVLVAAKKSKSGTTFIVQGPPGIGKTALLAECWEKAKKRRWQVAEIDLVDLWNADKLGQTLRLSTKKITRMKSLGGVGKLGSSKGELGAQFEATSKVDLPMATSLRLIQKTRKPLLLILDEAQRLGESNNINGPYKDEVSDLLYRIHNGKVGKPVILLAGGLGMTYTAFKALGISRMSDEFKFDMQPLEVEEERKVIQDWLTKEGKAKGDTTPWVDAITQETYRWARHVHSYATCAARVVKQNGGNMTEEGLRFIMEKGREARWRYYKDRMEGLEDDHILRLEEMFRSTQARKGLSKVGIIRHLGKAGFEKAVSQGVLYRYNDSYTIPIPSLYDYLTEKAGRIREAMLRDEEIKKQEND